jgi:hypothetical protein
MDEEYNFLIENQTWDLVFLPFDQKLVQCKCIYRFVSIYKTRFLAKGFQQVHGINYDETFAPMAKMDSIQLDFGIAATRKWEVHHMDVNNAFIHDYLEEKIYME